MICGRVSSTSNLPDPFLVHPTILNQFLRAKVLQCRRNPFVHGHVSRHSLETDFGDMQLLVEEISTQRQLQLTEKKLQIYQQHPHLFPVVYEHVLIEHDRSQRHTLLELREQTTHVNHPTVQKSILDLIETLYVLQHNGMEIIEMVDSIEQSVATLRYYVDSSKIRQAEKSEPFNVRSFLQQLSAFEQVDILNKLYLLQDQVYTWSIQPQQLHKLAETEMNWLYLSILMNIPFVKAVEVEYQYIHQELPRKGRIEELSGEVILRQHPNISFMFRSGKCINQYQPMTPQQLKRVYFSPQKIYRVSKNNCVTISKQDNNINKNESFAIIEQSIEKIQCVEFFIVYMKYFELSIERIIFKRTTNELEMTLSQGKYVVIRFPLNYCVKEDELAIILNKSHLVNCELSLCGLQVSDKLLILLSNLEKTTNIRKLDLSYCTNLTAFSLTNAFQSPLCSNIAHLNLSGTATNQETLRAIKCLPALKYLYINNCKALSLQSDSHQLISLKDTKLQVLQAINSNVSTEVNSTLQVLMLTAEFPIQNLKLLSKMPLVELKLRLVENSKQQIISFVSSLYSKTIGYVKEFCQGAPGRNLRSIDLSDSQIRYKLIRSILQIKSLVEVKLNGCGKLGDEFDTLGLDIETIQVRETVISARNLRTLLQKPIFIKYLDVRGSSLDKRDVYELIQSINKQFNQVFVDQQQYSGQLLQILNRQKGSSFNKLSVRVSSSMNQKFLSMIYNVNKSGKLVNFDCDQTDELIITKRIASFLGSCEKATFRIRNQQSKKILNKQIRNFSHIKNELNLSQCRSMTEFALKVCSAVRVHAECESLRHINLSNNRSLSSECIRLLTQYCSRHVCSINFRNCLFTFNEVSSLLCEWPSLTNVNNGQFFIKWQHSRFPEMCQKMLRFFMRIQKVSSLVLEVRKVKEVQLLFSILYYIINHHKLTLEVFKLKLIKLNLELDKSECGEFWEALLTTITLRSLAIDTENCINFDKHHYGYLSSINRLHLYNLVLRLPQKMPFYPRIGSLAMLKLSISGELFVSDGYLAESIKYCENMESLELDLNCCQNMTSLERFCSQLKRLRRLKSIIMSMQYCPLRGSFMSNMIEAMKELTYLNKICLDISFSCEVTEDITIPLIKLADQLNHPYIEIIGLNVFRRGALEFQMELQDNNIRVVY